MLDLLADPQLSSVSRFRQSARTRVERPTERSATTAVTSSSAPCRGTRPDCRIDTWRHLPRHTRSRTTKGYGRELRRQHSGRTD